MIRVRFEESRAGYPVPPNCPVWRPVGEAPIPIIRMETQHIKNAMLFLLRKGRREWPICKGWYVAMKHPGRNRSGTAAALLLQNSVRRLRYMELWYGRFAKELTRRNSGGEEIAGYLTRLSEEGSSSRTWRDRIAGGVDRLRNLLPAPKGAAPDQ